MHSHVIYLNRIKYLQAHDEGPHCNNNTKHVCSEIVIKWVCLATTCLIDRGSMLTAVSLEFYKNNIKTFSKCPTLPLANVEAISFSGEKSRKIKKKLKLDLSIGNVFIQAILFVIPNLIKECILGIDSIYELDMIIYVKKRLINIGENLVKFNKSAMLDSDESKIDSIITDTAVTAPMSSTCSEYDITFTEVDERVNFVANISEQNKEKLR